MNAPTLRPDGSCPACAGGWQCAFHRAEGVAKFNEREKLLREVAVRIRQDEIDRTCARLELESDEFLTSGAKALAIIDQNRA